MSNNTPDYDNNLAFEPTSADDLNKQRRQSEHLTAAIERCERLEKQLKIAIKALESLRTKKTVIDKVTGDVCYIWDYALKKIKELDR